MSGAQAAASVRERLAKATRAQHLYLHRDPLLSRLAASDLTQAEYFGALKVLHGLHVAVEQAREDLGRFAELSLRAECAALARDLEGSAPCRKTPLVPIDAGDTLGALYVARGSGFGRKVLSASVAKALPEVPRSYLSRRADPRTWSQLCATLEVVGASDSGYRKLLRGASGAFAMVAALSRAEFYRLKVPQEAGGMRP